MLVLTLDLKDVGNLGLRLADHNRRLILGLGPPVLGFGLLLRLSTTNELFAVNQSLEARDNLRIDGDFELELLAFAAARAILKVKRVLRRRVSLRNLDRDRVLYERDRVLQRVVNVHTATAAARAMRSTRMRVPLRQSIRGHRDLLVPLDVPACLHC